MSDYRAAVLFLTSCLSIILGLIAARELDYKLRDWRLRRRAERRKGWM